MDYTDLDTVKSYMDSAETAKDTVISYFITAASRWLDRLCTNQPNVVDYFKTEDVADELLMNGKIDYAGRLWIYPHKPIINSVASLSYRYRLIDPFIVADPTLIIPFNPESAMFEGQLTYAEYIYVKISYNGGLATDTAGLPQDFVDLATLLTIRLYKEARSGLGDAIGVAELGTMVYTKAFPIRLTEGLNIGTFARMAEWT